MGGMRAWNGLAAIALLALPVAALADVKAGVDAWSAGDYERAVTEWRDPAARGDPDALFNLAQAYRLGRGVEQDAAQAEAFYARAAAQGHLKAADNLGLLLFHDGRREQAMPYVKAAADRGDPRAQYLLGIAHFNGVLVEKDWVRAYALLTLANAAGLPQAAPAIAQMDDFIPLEQRQEAQLLAPRIKQDADVRRASQMAAADLGSAALAEAVQDRPGAAPQTRGSGLSPVAAARIPQPIAKAPVTPSVAGAQAALADAAQATAAQSPAETGASYVGRGSSSSLPAAPAGKAVPAAASRPAASAAGGGGEWKVQLGAFSIRANADRLWDALAGRAELAGATRLLITGGKLTRLQAGGFASQEEAQRACDALKRSGHGCLVMR